MKIKKLKSIKKLIKFLPYLPQTIYFNFHYLPFRQARKMPILLYRPHLCKCKGSVVIESAKIYTGMITLGTHRCRVYPNSGFHWLNEGGKCLFKGSANIGNDSYVCIVGKNAFLSLGNNFQNTGGMKIACYRETVFDEHALIGWGVKIMDTPFHKLKTLDGLSLPSNNKGIHIGKNNWIATDTLILPGAGTPDFCTVAARSVLRNDFSNEMSHIMLAGNPLSIKKCGVWMDEKDNYVKDI